MPRALASASMLLAMYGVLDTRPSGAINGMDQWPMYGSSSEPGGDSQMIGLDLSSHQTLSSVFSGVGPEPSATATRPGYFRSEEPQLAGDVVKLSPAPSGQGRTPPSPCSGSP